MTNTNLSNEEIRRYSRHLILPEFGMAGQRRLKEGSVLLIGAGGLGSPLALYLAAAGVGHIGLVDFDVVDESNLQRQIVHGTSTIGVRKTEFGQATAERPEPECRGHNLRRAGHVGERLRADAALRCDCGRHRQLPDPLPDQRCQRDARQAECLRLDLPLRGPGDGVLPQGGRAVLSLPVPRAAAARPGAELRRGRRAGRAAGRDRHDPGDRGDQAAGRHRRDAGESPDALRCAGDALPRAEAAPQPGLPGLRRPPDGDRADRLRACSAASRPSRQTFTSHEITPIEVNAWLHSDDPPFLLDVREPNEWEIGHLPDATRISVNELQGRLNELDTAREMVVYCRSGVRSGRAVDMLRAAGFRKVKNMTGGILRWSDEVDLRSEVLTTKDTK